MTHEKNVEIENYLSKRGLQILSRTFFDKIYYIFKEFENLSVEKKMLSTALGFEPRSFNCRSTAQLISNYIYYVLVLKKHY